MEYIIIITLISGFIGPFILLFPTVDYSKIKGIYPFIYIVLIASLYELIFSYFLKFNVVNWFLVYEILSFGGIHYFFYHLLEKKNRGLFLILVILFLVLFICINFNLTPISISNFLIRTSIFKTLQTFIIVFFSILWFRKVFGELKDENLFNNPNFYFVSGLNICYAGTVLLFLISHYVHNSNPKAIDDFWIMNIILNLFLRILLVVGLWKARAK
jgi:hypothetical protein